MILLTAPVDHAIGQPYMAGLTLTGEEMGDAVTGKFCSVSDSHLQISAAATLEKDSIILLFSYSGATTNGLQVLELAKMRGIKTILVTRFPAPWRDIVLVSWLTGGQRLGDCCCLRWDCVDFKRGIVSFRTDKTGQEICNPIRPTLRTRLLAIREEQGGRETYVFPNMARKYRNANSSVSTEFTALLKAWGILETETEKKALKGRNIYRIRKCIIN